MTDLEKAIKAFEIALGEPIAEDGTICFYAIVEPAARTALEALREKEARDRGRPCDLCRFAPPSSCDGKPCCLCPASAVPEAR